MITAVIQHKKDTLVVELPRANTDLQIKLLSIGVRTLPQNIKLFGGEDAEIDVQLASSSRVGQHLCRLFNTENSLGDVNTTASCRPQTKASRPTWNTISTTTNTAQPRS